MARLVVLMLGVAAPLGFASSAAAHPVPFTYLDIKIQQGALELTLVAHVFDVAHELGVEPPDRLLDPAVLAPRAGEVIALLRNRLHMAAARSPVHPPRRAV
jgi:hypothetical protein